MGEYYSWVNVDKKELICPGDFNFGNKSHESLVRGNEFLNALRELLSREWVGDHIVFIGDETLISEDNENITLRMLYGHTVQANYPGDAMDTICETYKNVGGLFKAAEAEVRAEIRNYIMELKTTEEIANEYGIDITDPYDGLFLRNGQDFRYTINHSKRVCYSFDKTKILYRDGKESDFADPLPLLMRYGGGSHMISGEWVGDIIGVSDEYPDGYELLQEIYLDW